MSKKIYLFLGVIFIMFNMVVYPNICITGAQAGLLLWFNKVLPTLLPFIILTNLLTSMDIISKISSFSSSFTKKLFSLPGDSLFALTMGFISGYPMGAKITGSLLKDGKITQNEAQRMLCFCNNCGPLFIIGVVALGTLKNAEIGYFLILIQILSAITLGILLKAYNNKITSEFSSTSRKKSPSNSFAKIFNTAIQNSMDTIVYIGGYIIFFSVLIHILKNSHLLTQSLKSFSSSTADYGIYLSLISGTLELSNGIHLLESIPTSLPLIAAVSFMIGFGGFCVHFQAMYVLGPTNLSISMYIYSKFIQGIFCYLYTFLLFPVFTSLKQHTFIKLEYKWIVFLALFSLISFLSFKLIHTQHIHQYLAYKEKQL